MGNDFDEIEKIEGAVLKLRRQSDDMFGDLQKAKQEELSCQRCKERLLKEKELKAVSIQTRLAAVEDVIATLPTSSRKLFNQLYSQVDEIYQLELLLLELKQRLMVAKATREEERILNALRKGSCERKRRSTDSNDDHACILSEWFQQISCVKNGSDPDTNLTMTSKDGSCIEKDRVFYWAKYEMSPNSVGSRTLRFSTRHCGICLRLCIAAPIRLSEGSPGCSPDDFSVTSDLPLEGLQLGLQRSIQDGQMAHEFVIRTVWRLIEQQMVSLTFN
ncbi:uncharacterized protein LOC119740217 [Patiria miniata]|uniref:Uncharacterized protein n=1 Tax=Patiria miniata TaxID=46514 RepID=A0A914B535_PATMI|nr:uncharacterized protein LOC119740217 [Patiria miniata]